jgi:CheY-like chemotaxis protein
MAPEQATAGAVDARADVYALGVIGFELLTGRVPFSATSPYEIARLHVEAPVPAHLLLEAGVPGPLAELVLECLEKSPDRRPSSGNVLEARLVGLSLETAPVVETDSENPRPPRTRVIPREDVAPDLRTQPVAAVPPFDTGTPAVTVAVQSPEAHLRRPVVLVADDDEHFVAFARMVLEADGIEVRTGSSGEEALHALHGSNVDLALIDLWMPAADGLDVLRIHRAQNPDRPVPAILVSASVSRAQIAFAVRLGALEVLAKPLAPEQLASVVRKHLLALGHAPPG